MTELLLIDIQLTAVNVKLAHGRKIELAGCQAQDAHIIDGHPRALLDGTIAKGIESISLPSELLDRVGGLRHPTQITQEFYELLVLGHPNVVAHAEETLAQGAAGCNLLHIQLYETWCGLWVVILDLEKSDWVEVITDMEERLQLEVAPLDLVTILVGAEV